MPRNAIKIQSRKLFVATFLDTRTSRSCNNGFISARDFARFSYQRNSDNFRYIRGHQIASLSDRHHGRTLRYQSYAIRNAPKRGKLTLLVHGQGGRASDFTNNGVTRDLAYNNNSLIERF